jgi:DNA-binding transcriptional MocR family regulator
MRYPAEFSIAQDCTGDVQICAGAKVPSIRQFAGVMHVSKSTGVEAYDRLAG